MLSENETSNLFSQTSSNPFPNKTWFLRVCSINLLKTLWKKEKLLVKSNFSFSHSVLYPFKELSAIFTKLKIVVCKLFQFGGVQNLSYWKGFRDLLTESANYVTYDRLSINTGLTKIWNFINF